ncbi:hypothetical protein TRFO_34697 [Tritrichomonas foetus]|uniref:Uncharacterized protein n=1 Tax=Tritrichomonas foetus TaxID=1144522 RepID=A0A1J4JKK9_9EUKA|nr:hypothetical protein TRFO_34697 [Tritrichomonas foetus]|eukprot:OHS98935.1 hypothetical protein TRFO_34697 [Tritrichomonas foetus]
MIGLKSNIQKVSSFKIILSIYDSKMYGWGASPFQNSIMKLLADPNAKLEAVLMDRLFNNTFRTENQTLINFLVRDDNLSRMLDYILTDAMSKEPDARKILFLCLNVLTSESEKFGEKLAESQIYISRLNNFKGTQYVKNPIYCGYYANLVESLAKVTNGEVLGSKMKYLGGFLIKNLHFLGLRQLFIRLVINFGVPFKVSSGMMKLMTDQLHDQKLSIYVAFTINDIIDLELDNCQLFQSPDVFDTIMKTAIENYTKTPILSSTLLKAAIKILKNSDNIQKENILKYENLIDFNGPVNCATASLLTLFPHNVTKFIDRFLLSELPTIFNEKVTSIINKMTIDELQQLSTSLHLSSLFSENFKNYKNGKINGHFLSLARTFADKGICCCEEHNDVWARFVNNKMAKQYRKTMMEYGGHITEESKNIQRDLFVSMDDLYAASMNLSSILVEEEEEEENENENEK